MNKYLIKSILFLLLTTTVIAQKDSVKLQREYNTVQLPVGEDITIDGILSEISWDNVAWQDDFTVFEPNNGEKASQRTKFKITYDAKFLYVGIRCFDSIPEKIEQRLARRDNFSGDWIEVNIDSYNDKRTGFSFNVSAAGVKGDEFISQNGDFWDASWNPIWYTATNIDEEGWTAEMKIPFSQLKFGAAEEQLWGLQIHRRYFRGEERSIWQPISLEAPGWVSEFGKLTGLKNIEPQKQLEIQPFVVNQFDKYPAQEGNPFRDGKDYILNAGLDAKIGLTNDLTLDLTVNPDFGQVDADPGAIALDGFQIFFEERRPFFIEN